MFEYTEQGIINFLKDSEELRKEIKKLSNVQTSELYLILDHSLAKLDKLNFKKTRIMHQITDHALGILYSDNYVYLKGNILTEQETEVFNSMAKANVIEDVFVDYNIDEMFKFLIEGEILFLNLETIQRELCSASLSTEDVLQIKKIYPKFENDFVSNINKREKIKFFYNKNNKPEV